MRRIEAIYQAADAFINVPDEQVEVKKAMGVIMVSECLETVPLLIRLYEEVEAANEHVELDDIGCHWYSISVEAWDRIEAALKAIKEAE